MTPDTILRWHRRLVAQKWTHGSPGRTGRPGLVREIAELIVRMAKDNPNWGYRRIQGALRNVGHEVAHNTVRNALKNAGIEPPNARSERRGPSS